MDIKCVGCIIFKNIAMTVIKIAVIACLIYIIAV